MGIIVDTTICLGLVGWIYIVARQHKILPQDPDPVQASLINVALGFFGGMAFRDLMMRLGWWL